MTWDDDGEEILCQGIANGTGSIGALQMHSDALIAADSPTGDPMFCSQNHLLKFGTKVHTYHIKRKRNVITIEKSFNVIGNALNLRTRTAGRFTK